MKLFVTAEMLIVIYKPEQIQYTNSSSSVTKTNIQQCTTAAVVNE